MFKFRIVFVAGLLAFLVVVGYFMNSSGDLFKGMSYRFRTEPTLEQRSIPRSQDRVISEKPIIELDGQKFDLRAFPDAFSEAFLPKNGTDFLPSNANSFFPSNFYIKPYEETLVDDGNCATYHEAGTYQLRPCDKAIWNQNQYVMEVTSVGTNYMCYYLTMNFKGGTKNRYFLCSGKKKKFWEITDSAQLPHGSKNNELGPYSTRYGSNFLVKDYSNEYATVSFYNDCDEIYKYCQDNGGYNCEYSCFYRDIPKLNTHVEVIEKPHIALVIDGSHSTWGKVMAQNAENCYEKESSETGMEVPTKIPIYYYELILYNPKYGNINDAFCTYGDYDGKVVCRIFAGGYDNKDIYKNEKYNNLKSKVDAGECVDEDPMGVQSHEIGHQYSILTFDQLLGFLSEPIAQYLGDIANYGTLQHVCFEDVFYWNNYPGEFIKHYPFGPASYTGGSCLLRDLKDIYGAQKFKEFFNFASKLQIPSNKLSSDEMDTWLFKDVINPVFGDDVLTKFQGKYGIKEDISDVINSDHPLSN
ncbi:hypothetical protein COU74_02105 [Candidatus Peregrinibacteria bacterium CG10_big_fil_rev_8_21_14_0_10_36_19]|nr:MAG: hypothetical protein COU74_02105 [Candidatus Peregrinibacteria bacterium CG10_big_fil_rev_8_21_14_0_10_36_19]